MTKETKEKIARMLSLPFIIFYKIIYAKKVSFGKNVIVNWNFKIRGKGKLIVGDNTNLGSYNGPVHFYFYNKDAIITIGKNSRLNGIMCHCAKSITIGENFLCGDSIIMDTDFHTFSNPNHILYKATLSKAVSIGNDVWLGGQSTVLKGCNIGDKSVVGFRAVVTQDVPSNTIVGGNPAKVIKSKKSFAK